MGQCGSEGPGISVHIVAYPPSSFQGDPGPPWGPREGWSCWSERLPGRARPPRHCCECNPKANSLQGHHLLASCYCSLFSSH